jgi:prepilin-type processing-associated H-X9-DG protein
MLANAPAGVNGTTNAQVVGSRVSVYECPSDRSPPAVVQGGGTGATARTNARRSNYLFAYFTATDYDSHLDRNPRGPFGGNSRTRIADITDGTSTTIAIGESQQIKSTANFGPYWGSGARTAVYGHVGNASYHINFPFAACPDRPGMMCQGAGGFGSYHPGGANFVFCDGSVRFLPETMPFVTFRDMNSMNGGEVIDAGTYE